LVQMRGRDSNSSSWSPYSDAETRSAPCRGLQHQQLRGAWSLQGPQRSGEKFSICISTVEVCPTRKSEPSCFSVAGYSGLSQWAASKISLCFGDTPTQAILGSLDFAVNRFLIIFDKKNLEHTYEEIYGENAIL